MEDIICQLAVRKLGKYCTTTHDHRRLKRYETKLEKEGMKEVCRKVKKDFIGYTQGQLYKLIGEWLEKNGWIDQSHMGFRGYKQAWVFNAEKFDGFQNWVAEKGL